MLHPFTKCFVESATLIMPTVTIVKRTCTTEPLKNCFSASLPVFAGHFVACTMINYANILSDLNPELNQEIQYSLIPSAGVIKDQIIHSLAHTDATYLSYGTRIYNSAAYHNKKNFVNLVEDYTNSTSMKDFSYHASPIFIETTCSLVAELSMKSSYKGMLIGAIVSFSTANLYTPSLDYLETTSYGKYNALEDPIVNHANDLLKSYLSGNITEY